jgi:hypothetical protein
MNLTDKKNYPNLKKRKNRLFCKQEYTKNNTPFKPKKKPHSDIHEKKHKNQEKPQDCNL